MLFITGISCNYRDSPYKGDWGGHGSGPAEDADGGTTENTRRRSAARGRRTSQLLSHMSATCPGRKAPFWAVKRPMRPYKSPLQERF